MKWKTIKSPRSNLSDLCLHCLTRASCPKTNDYKYMIFELFPCVFTLSLYANMCELFIINYLCDFSHAVYAGKKVRLAAVPGRRAGKASTTRVPSTIRPQ